MYPYVDPSVILHRSLALDDVRGLRDAYPAQGFATISGTIRRVSDNSLVLGVILILVVLLLPRGVFAALTRWRSRGERGGTRSEIGAGSRRRQTLSIRTPS